MLNLELVELNHLEKQNALLVAIAAEKANLVNYAKTLDVTLQMCLALYFPILLIDIKKLAEAISKVKNNEIENISNFLDSELLGIDIESPVRYVRIIPNHPIETKELNKVFNLQIKALLHYVLIRAINDTMSIETLYVKYCSENKYKLYVSEYLESSINDIAINSLMSIEGKLKYINRYES
jgi:hypothetical protein